MRRSLLRFLVTFTLLATPVAVGHAHAADKPTIATLNVSAQAGITLASAAMQGRIHGVRDVVRTLTAGAASGAGIYEAKALIGDGRVAAGWILANVTGSVSENVAAGRHPLAQIGYSIGPMRLRVSIPRFDPDSDARVHADLSGWEGFMAVQAARESSRMELRSGLIGFRRSTPYPGDGAVGATFGLFPGVADNDPVTWQHEVIHAVQDLQIDLVEPAKFGFAFRRSETQPADHQAWFRIEHLKNGVFNVANHLLLAAQPYDRRWVEIEAYRLADKAEPTR